MATVYKNGVLSEQESLADRLQRIAASPGAAMTPYGAQAAGASPDSAKMASSPQRKAAVAKELAPKEQTLGYQQRTSTAQRGQTAAEQAQVDRTQKVGALGSLSQGVQNKVQQLIAGAGQAVPVAMQADADRVAKQLGFDSSAVASERNPNFSAILEGLTVLGGLTDPAAREQKLRDLSTLGLDVTNDADAVSLYKQAAPTVGAAVAGGVQPSGVTLGQMQPQDLGFDDWDQLATTLGVDAATAQGWSVDDVQKQIGALKDEEASATRALQAQINGAPPGSVKRAIYERQLQDLAQGGAAVAYQNLANTLAAVDLASKVKIGDNDYDVATVLDDDQLSGLIDKYMLATTDAQRESLLPAAQFGDLRNWIKDNELSLSLMSHDIGSSEQAFTQAQHDSESLGTFNWLQPAEGKQLAPTSFSPTMVAALLDDPLTPEKEYDPERQYTSQEIAAFREKLTNSSFAKLAQAGESAILNDVTADDLNELAGLTPEQIKQSHDLGIQLADHDLAAWTGLPSGDKFVDPAQAQAIATAATNMSAVKAKYPDIMRDQDFVDLDVGHKNQIATDPEAQQTWKRFTTARKLAGAEDVKDLLIHALGPQGETLLDSNAYDQVARYAALGDPGAQAQLARFKELFGGDGKPTPDALEYLKGKLVGSAADKSLADQLDHPTFSDWGDQWKNSGDVFTKWSPNTPASVKDPTTFWQTLESKLDPNGKLSSDGFAALLNETGATVGDIYPMLPVGIRGPNFPKNIQSAHGALQALKDSQTTIAAAEPTPKQKIKNAALAVWDDTFGAGEGKVLRDRWIPQASASLNNNAWRNIRDGQQTASYFAVGGDLSDKLPDMLKTLRDQRRANPGSKDVTDQIGILEDVVKANFLSTKMRAAAKDHEAARQRALASTKSGHKQIDKLYDSGYGRIADEVEAEWNKQKNELLGFV